MQRRPFHDHWPAGLNRIRRVVGPDLVLVFFLVRVLSVELVEIVSQRRYEIATE